MYCDHGNRCVADGPYIGINRFERLRFLCKLIILGCIFPLQAEAKASDTLTIGMLSYRPLSFLQSSWGNLENHLEKWLPGTRVYMRFLNQDEMAVALQNDELDLVFTNPAHYIQLRAHNALSGAIATLASINKERPVPYISGVVIRRKERDDVQHWKDLQGKVVAVTGTQYLGGYAAQAWELIERGIALDSVNFNVTGNPHDRVIAAVLAGDVDAGFIRSGVLESLMQHGEKGAAELMVLEPVMHSDFPFMSSTALYPEWPMVALPHLDRDVSRRISAALLALEPDDVLSRSAGIHGFMIPSDYQRVKEVMIAAHMPPFDQLQSIDLREFAREHALSGAALGLMLLTLSSAAIWTAWMNRRLAQAQSRLAHELKRLDNVIRGSNAGTWELHYPGNRLVLDSRGAGLLGYGFDELQQGPLEHWEDLIHPSDREKVRNWLGGLLAGQSESLDTEFRMRHRNGTWIWVGSHGSVIERKENGCLVLAGVILDVSERARLEEEQKLGHAVFLQTHAGVMITDENNLIVQVNPAFTDITGYSRDEILGKSPSFLSSGYHDKAFYNELWSTLKESGKWTGEIVNRHKNGHTFIERISIARIPDQEGRVVYHIAIFTDISLQKQLIAELQHSANHDMLTGLPNRNLLNDRINLAIAHARRCQRGVAIIFLDLDGFKPVNDTHGHAAGDILLKEIGGRIKEVVRGEDTVARVGGDEFVVVVNEVLVREDAIKCAENILAVINKPVDLQRADQTVRVFASLGVLVLSHVMAKAFSASSEFLLEQADMLMYQAKNAGRARMVVQFLNDEDGLKDGRIDSRRKEKSEECGR